MNCNGANFFMDATLRTRTLAAIGGLSLAAGCWAVPAEPKRQSAAVGPVTITLDRTVHFSEHCYAATVFNGTNQIIDTFVRFDFRYGPQRWTSDWFGRPTRVEWGIPGESIARIGAGLHFENLNPGESKRIPLVFFKAPSGSGQDLGAMIWDWGKNSGSCDDDFEISLASDGQGPLRWEVNDVQRAFDRLKSERDQRLKDNATLIQRLTEPVPAKAPSQPARASGAQKDLRVAQVPNALNPNANRTPPQLDLPGPVRRGPGELLAAADELREKGNSAGARAKLRELIAAYPDHPLSAQAAEQLTGETKPVAVAPPTAAVKASKSPCDLSREERERLSRVCLPELEASVQEARRRLGDRFDPDWSGRELRKMLSYCPDPDPVKRKTEWAEYEHATVVVFESPRSMDYARCMFAARGLDKLNLATAQVPSTQSTPQVGCNAAMDQLSTKITASSRRPLPAGAIPPLQRVMWATAEAIKTIDSHCAGQPDRQVERRDYQKAYQDAEAACKAMSGGSCPGANPF